MGRPRPVPPFDRTGVAGMNHRLRDIVVEALGVRGIVGIGRGDADEEILKLLAGQQIAVVQRLLAEIGEQRVARMIDLDRIDVAASLPSDRRARPACAPAPPCCWRGVDGRQRWRLRIVDWPCCLLGVSEIHPGLYCPCCPSNIFRPYRLRRSSPFRSGREPP